MMTSTTTVVESRPVQETCQNDDVQPDPDRDEGMPDAQSQEGVRVGSQLFLDALRYRKSGEQRIPQRGDCAAHAHEDHAGESDPPSNPAQSLSSKPGRRPPGGQPRGIGEGCHQQESVHQMQRHRNGAGT
jgi:hypothetical protein